MKNLKLFLFFSFLSLTFPFTSKATDKNYSKAAGHTGVYILNPYVRALKCNIETVNHASNNNLGWYSAWPMIVDYKTERFVQLGYITFPKKGINEPTFFVAWSNDGKNINVEYLPNANSSGSALKPRVLYINGYKNLINNHEYALSLNIDGSVNIQIDGIKYFTEPDNRIIVGIKYGKGEFFAEGSNVGVDISTKFYDCRYMLKNDTYWQKISVDKNNVLYHVANGTEINLLNNDSSFEIMGKIDSVNKGKFIKKIKSKITNLIKNE